MADTKKYYWLKLKDDFFRDKRIKKLRRIAGGDTYTVIYLKMQLLSIKNNGVLIYEGIEDNFAEELALELDEDVDNVKVTLAFLQGNGMIEETEQDHFLMTETIKCIGSESASAERVRKHREKKTQKALQCNTQVTLGNTEIEKEKDLDLELEEEKEKDIKEKPKTAKKESKKEPNGYDAIISQSSFNDEVKEIVIEFIKMRKLIKKPMTDYALKKLLNKLARLSSNPSTQIAILEKSINNNWLDIYEPKEEVKQEVKQEQPSGDVDIFPLRRMIK